MVLMCRLLSISLRSALKTPPAYADDLGKYFSVLIVYSRNFSKLSKTVTRLPLVSTKSTRFTCTSSTTCISMPDVSFCGHHEVIFHTLRHSSNSVGSGSILRATHNLCQELISLTSVPYKVLNASTMAVLNCSSANFLALSSFAQ